jgi:hypothetical protein
LLSGDQREVAIAENLVGGRGDQTRGGRHEAYDRCRAVTGLRRLPGHDPVDAVRGGESRPVRIGGKGTNSVAGAPVTAFHLPSVRRARPLAVAAYRPRPAPQRQNGRGAARCGSCGKPVSTVAPNTACVQANFSSTLGSSADGYLPPKQEEVAATK